LLGLFGEMLEGMGHSVCAIEATDGTDAHEIVRFSAALAVMFGFSVVLQMRSDLREKDDKIWCEQREGAKRDDQ
jgi:hypothetical protein